MAVQNSLQKKETANEQAVEYMAGGTKVKLTPSIVRDYLVSGDKDHVSFQEIAMFMNLCKFSGLNPWLKEAYCIKYGNEPATMVVGKEAFEKRAEENPNYDGDESGIIVVNEEGVISYRKGTLKLPGEEIVGGYAEVWRKDRRYSTRIEVSFDEYAGRKKDGSLNSNWSKKPATMIRKVALVQALREAFPKSFDGMYIAEEQGIDEPNFSVSDVIEMQKMQVIAENSNEPLNIAKKQAEPIQQPEAPQDVQMALFGK